MMEKQAMSIDEDGSGDASGRSLVEDTPEAITRSKTRRRTSRKVLGLVIVLLFLLAAVVAVFAVLFFLEKEKDKTVDLPEVKTNNVSGTSDDVCTTHDCVVTISDLLNSIDPTVDPCVDFYSYACGGWVKKNPPPEDSQVWNHWNKLEKEVQAFIKNSLRSKEIKARYSKIASVIKAFDFYYSCMSSPHNNDSMDHILELIDKFVAWPPLNPRWNKSAFDLVATLAALNKELNIDPFFTTLVESDLKNSTENMITFKQTFIGGLFHGQFTRNSPHAIKARNAYKETMAELMELLGVEDKAKREQLAEEILEVEIGASNLSRSFNAYNEVELYGRYTINELNNITGFSSIDWLRYINLIYKDLGKTFTGEEYVIAYDIPYFINIANYLQGLSKRTLMTYTGWIILLKNYPYLNHTFLKVQDKFQRQAFGFGSISRQVICYNRFKEYFDMPVSRVFIDARFRGDSKSLAEEISTMLREAFTEDLQQNSWMDKESRSAAVQKAKFMVNNIGYPDYILDDKKLDKTFERVMVYNDSFFETMLTINANTKRNEYILALEPVDRKRWSQSPLLVNAAYEPTENKMIFPAAFLQPPFYDRRYSKAVSYGGIGTIMGHELVHGFDNNGKDFDKDGNNVKWWSDATLAKFKERMQCLVQQYSNITFMDQQVDGKSTLPENIGDNGGIRQAFKAYQRWKKIHGEEPRLPGMMLSNDKVFFLSFARNWCVTYKSAFFAFDPFALDQYAPYPIRVNASLKNLPEFSRAFNCPLGSPMNPRMKCPTW